MTAKLLSLTCPSLGHPRLPPTPSLTIKSRRGVQEGGGMALGESGPLQEPQPGQVPREVSGSPATYTCHLAAAAAAATASSSSSSCALCRLSLIIIILFPQITCYYITPDTILLLTLRHIHPLPASAAAAIISSSSSSRALCELSLVTIILFPPVTCYIISITILLFIYNNICLFLAAAATTSSSSCVL